MNTVNNRQGVIDSDYLQRFHMEKLAYQQAEKIAFFSGLVVTLGLIPFLSVLTALSLGLVSFALIWYIESLGKDAGIIQITALIASLQWLLGPFFAYHYEGVTAKYLMYVPEDQYLTFVVPSVFMLIVGMRLGMPHISYQKLRDYLTGPLAISQKNIYIMICIGLFAGVITNYVPASLRFLMFILIQFKFIGAVYLLMGRYRRRFIVVFLLFLLTLWSSADNGMFHNLLLWSAFLFSFICMDLKISRFKKYLWIIIAVVSIVSLQSVKSEFRLMSAEGYDGSKVELLLKMMLGESDSEYITGGQSDFGDLNARLNQGWIISAVMSYVPRMVDYEDGATVVRAITDAVLSRVISHKRKVAVSDNFRKYTGLQVSRNTSFGISVLGEAWVNFGLLGGILFMFVWGGAIGGLLRALAALSSTYPTAILWAPLLFLQVVKAETELVTVLNHGVKVGLVLWFLYWFAYRVIRVKI